MSNNTSKYRYHKYICDSCKEVQFLSTRIHNSKAIPRCKFCGSYALDPSSGSSANERLAEAMSINSDRISKNREKQGYED